MTDSVRSKIERTRRAVAVPPASIAQRAFELFAARGGAHGHDVEDWLHAERELIERAGGGKPRRSRKALAND
jgi:hypothetical protein